MPELDLGNVMGPEGKSAYQGAIDAGYSGSETAFNEALANARYAVRYDAAQSLTDDQKTQARSNIGAAPSGYGYGASITCYNFTTDYATLTAKFDEVLAGMSDDTVKQILLYDASCNPTQRMCSARIARSSATEAIISTDFDSLGHAVVYRKRNSVWLPVEYVNPAFTLGVEYRTTEWYLGYSVYVKLINLGAMPSAGGTKRISVSDLGIRVPISMDLTWGNVASENFVINNYAPYVSSAGFDNANINIVGGPSADTEHYTIYALLKYSKNE